MTLIMILLAVCGGATLSIQAAINGQLGSNVGVFKSAFLTFSVGALVTALLTLGLENDMDSVAAMETDMIGLAHERRRLEGKTGSKDKISYDF